LLGTPFARSLALSIRKVLFLLLVLVVGVIALGWYLEWFQFVVTRQAETGKKTVFSRSTCHSGSYTSEHAALA
jgi:hypothetical protein